MMTVLFTACSSPQKDTPVPEAEKTAPETEEAAPAPETVPNQTVKLYLPNGNADGFVIEEPLLAADAGPQGLVDLLLQRGALPEGSKVLDFRQDAKAVNVSMNRAYCDSVASMGTAEETMLLGSLVNTLLTFCEADALNLTCEGKVFSTGHNIYDFPLTFFGDNSQDATQVMDEFSE